MLTHFFPKKIFLSLLIGSLVFPLVILFLLSPVMDRIVISESEAEGLRLAGHIGRSLQQRAVPIDRGNVGEGLIREIRDIKQEFALYKVILFSASGEVVFSTEQNDVGIIATEKFFTEAVAQGKPFTSFRPRGSHSMEGALLSADVIEAYYPVMNGREFGGAIEVYYDITGQRHDFDRLKVTLAVVLYLISFFTSSAVVVLSRKTEAQRVLHAAAEKELSREQLKAETIFSALGDNVIIQDLEYRIIYQNALNREVFGNHKGEYCYRIYEGIDSICKDCPVELTYRDGEVHRTEKLVDTPRGPVYFELTSAPLRDSSGKITAGIKVVRDITARRHLEEQLRHSQKMEALGTLTSGISHEFNNVLTSIIGYSELLREELPADSSVRRYAEVIAAASKRAEGLTRGLLAYSRKQITKMSPLSLDLVIEDIRSMLSKIIGVNIQLRLQLAGAGLTIMADRNQLEQSLINVIKNACDAMPDGGELVISTGSIIMDDAFLGSHGFGRQGTYAMISVQDSGHGMDPEIQKRVFEPFFTTKDVGKGTGLGLSIVYGIVKNHYGYVEIISESGRGTDFRIYLPVAAAA